MDEGQGRGTGERGCPDNQADRSLNQYTARPDGQPAFDRAINLTNQRTNLVLVPEHHVLTDRPAYRLPVADDELEPRHFLPENLREALVWGGWRRGDE